MKTIVGIVTIHNLMVTTNLYSVINIKYVHKYKCYYFPFRIKKQDNTKIAKHRNITMSREYYGVLVVRG